MRILLVSDTYPPDINGAARFTERLGEGLGRRGHEVHVICASDDRRDRDESRQGVIVHRLRAVPWPFASYFRFVLPWDAAVGVRRLIRQIQPDVIHVQNHFILGRVALRSAPRLGVPVVATNHFMPENLMEHARIPWALARIAFAVLYRDLARAFRPAVEITAPTPRAVELLTARTGLAGGQAISCGIDTRPYQEASAAAEAHNPPRILFVGRLDQEKRVNELIEAVALLPGDLDYRVEIVGDGGYRQRWEELARTTGVSDRVQFRGFIGEADLIAAYGRCDIFCIPGVAELQSLVTLEAMSAGKPVVAADAMALPHLVRPGVNGWLYPPGDVSALAQHLEMLLRDPERRRQMGRESCRLVAAHSLDHTLDRFEQVYWRAVNP